MAQFYFAMVEPTDTTFDAAFARNDYEIISAELSQQEGDFAMLRVRVRNPRVGLLAVGRKIWAWFSWDAGSGLQPLIFARLVGIPTDVFGDIVTLDFIARPDDYVAQKQALADSLKELPYWDEIFIDPQRRNDPDLVLDARAALWHIDRVSHDVTISDLLAGEDGMENFASDEMRFDGLKLALNQSPLSSVSVDAVIQWTQLAQGSIDLTGYLTANWPNESASGVLTSFTLQASSWPSIGSSIGDGWTVAASNCTSQYDISVRHVSNGSRESVEWTDGDKVTLQQHTDDDGIVIPPGSIEFGRIITSADTKTTYAEVDGLITAVAFSSSANWTDGVVPLQYLRPTLSVAYQAERPMTERITFTLIADVQPLLTLPEDDAALRLDNLSSVNLSDPLDDGTDPEIPIGDPRRRSYIVTARGLQSLEYLIALARAHLLRRARAVEITIAPTIDRLPGISLRKSAIVNDPRLPGGTATGKIIGYRFAIDGSNGLVDFTLTIGCAIGRGGSVTLSDGIPTWAEADYAGPDWQEYSGRVVSFDSAVGYSPPLFNPNDDGLDFLGGLSVADVIDQPLSVSNPASVQRPVIEAVRNAWRFSGGGTAEDGQAMAAARTQAINATLAAVETVATFKLKSMKASFESPYEITVTDLKIPTMIDLEVP